MVIISMIDSHCDLIYNNMPARNTRQSSAMPLQMSFTLHLRESGFRAQSVSTACWLLRVTIRRDLRHIPSLPSNEALRPNLEAQGLDKASSDKAKITPVWKVDSVQGLGRLIAARHKIALLVRFPCRIPDINNHLPLRCQAEQYQTVL